VRYFDSTGRLAEVVWAVCSVALSVAAENTKPTQKKQVNEREQTVTDRQKLH
jgi:hypothetical protein